MPGEEGRAMTQNEQPAWQATPPAAPRPAENVSYAGFWIRVVAWIIDAIALAILTGAFAPLGGGGMPMTVESNGVTVNYYTNAVGTLIGLVYFVGLWAWRGQTIGMIPFRLYVVRVEDGLKPDIVRAFLRYVGLIISFVVFALGVIWVAFDGRKQGWHDKLAQTVVIRR
jgi:uncharacterized RDD family membrane protein YckC